MSIKEELFFPGWWKYALAGFVSGFVLHLLCGCSSPTVSGPAYPENDKWWTETSGPCKSKNLSDIGQGDVLVFDNGQEAVLL